MTRWFVSRHLGAIEWAKRTDILVDRWVSHLDPTQVSSGDIVMGTLPVHLAAQVCARGAQFYFLSLDMDTTQRGRELDFRAVQASGGHLQRYLVQPLATGRLTSL